MPLAVLTFLVALFFQFLDVPIWNTLIDHDRSSAAMLTCIRGLSPTAFFSPWVFHRDVTSSFLCSHRCLGFGLPMAGPCICFLSSPFLSYSSTEPEATTGAVPTQAIIHAQATSCPQQYCCCSPVSIIGCCYMLSFLSLALCFLAVWALGCALAFPP